MHFENCFDFQSERESHCELVKFETILSIILFFSIFRPCMVDLFSHSPSNFTTNSHFVPGFLLQKETKLQKI